MVYIDYFMLIIFTICYRYIINLFIYGGDCAGVGSM
jgi:hypothetical protein